MRRIFATRPAGPPPMVARAECRYRTIDLRGTPPRHLARAVEAQLIAWAPFPSAAFAIALRGERAMVYAWPDEIGSDWPESVHCAPPAHAEALRLVQCMRGVEGQYWLGGFLHASRWWPQAPSDAEWQNFQRGAQVRDELWLATCPAPIAANPQRQPTMPLRTLVDLRAAAALREHVIVAALSFTLAAAAAWQISAWMILDDARAQITADLARLRETAAPLEQARDEAITNAIEARGLAQALDGPSPADILQHLAQHIPGSGTIVREFEIHRNELNLALEVPDLTRRLDYLQSLERGGWLQNVVEQKGTAGLLNLRMTLGAGQPPAPSTATGTGEQPALPPQ